MCDVSANGGGGEGFKIRPKFMSMHGRQLVRRHDDTAVLNVAKMSKFRTLSIRENFAVSVGEDGLEPGTLELGEDRVDDHLMQPRGDPVAAPVQLSWRSR